MEEKQIRDEIKRGTSKLPPNEFQIENLEATIWTFEQIDKLQKAPIIITKMVDFHYFGDAAYCNTYALLMLW